MTKWTSVSRLARAAAVSGALAWLGCEPTPDYKLVVTDIPDSAVLLLVGWKSDSDTVSKTTLTVPVAQLSASERQSYSLGVSLPDATDAGGVTSLATVDKNGCLTSVVNAPDAPRSSGGSVTTLQLELDPQLNSAVVPLNPAYTDPSKCPKLPGLVTSPVPTEIGSVPTKPVAINALRQLSGPAGVFDGGRIALYGWGFDRGSMTIALGKDPSNCFPVLALTIQQMYPQYLPLFMLNWVFHYPSLALPSYAELDLQVSDIKAMVMPMPAPQVLLNGIIKCVAVSALTLNFVGQDGSTASFTEVLPM